MIAPIDYGSLADVVGRFPAHGSGANDAPPGHPFFGAAFLFVGSLMVVEMLAGDVWHRSRLRTMLWPVTLILAGLAMFIVVYVQPTEKPLHLTLAILLLLGGFVEGRNRLGQIPRQTADAIAIPVLILGGFVIGPMHANGPIFSSAAGAMHMLVGVMGWVLAGVRLVRMRVGATPAIDMSFAGGVMMLGLSLLLVQQFHAGH